MTREDVDRIPLTQWQFKQVTALQGVAQEYAPVTQFPTVAHLELENRGLVPDPNVDLNESANLWVNDATWSFRTEVPLTAAVVARPHIDCVFAGLDTRADVHIDGECVLAANNMHMSYRVDVSDAARRVHAEGRPLELEIIFHSNRLHAIEEWKAHPLKGKPYDLSRGHFGYPSRMWLRKAQYHWGWDWGPALCTAGPWKPITLEAYTSRFADDLRVQPMLAAGYNSAHVAVTGTLVDAPTGTRITLTLSGPDGGQLDTVNVSAGTDGSFSHIFEVCQPELWYPYTHGAQPRYTLAANTSHDAVSQTFGIRQVRLVQEPLKSEPGTSFLFEVNGLPVFCGGSDWIPGDYMLPRMTKQRYEKWLTILKEGNQNMVRVWGGGIVEDESFYDFCDREGILVWQDLMFACGNFPAHPEFVELVEQEVTQQVKRLRTHPSIVIIAGNNEDYMIAAMMQVEWDPSDEKGPWDNTNFPARIIYERVMPRIVEQLCDIPYWRSSPYGGDDANSYTEGDAHVWNVWHGDLAPYQNYKAYTSRFISEFGFESPPDIRTLNRCISDPSERTGQSRVYDAHDKCPGSQRRYALYMAENFRFRMDPMEDYVYCCHFLQAEALKYAFNLWRREFRGPGEYNCAGALVWQLNDIWPGSSWAIVDVDHHRKPAYYTTKRALAPIVVGLERFVTQKAHELLISYPDEKAAATVWVSNTSPQARDVTVRIAGYHVGTGKAANVKYEPKALKLAALTTLFLPDVSIPDSDQTCIVAYITDTQTGEQLARWVSWPQPIKYLKLSPRPNLQMKVAADESAITLSTDSPLKGVVLQVPISEGGDDAVFGDNFIDLVPDEKVRVEVQGLNGREVAARYLYDWESDSRKYLKSH